MKKKSNISEKCFSILCNKNANKWSDKKKKIPTEEQELSQKKEWKKFWERIGEEEPQFKNKIIVDYGCGYGYDSKFMLDSGAKHVYSLDIELDRLEGSKALHKANGYSNVTYIDNKNVDSLTEKIAADSIDIIICRNVMEHVPSPPDVLESMLTVLKPMGIAYIGFSPIYKSPFGSHIGGKCKVPWAHFMFSEKTIINVLKKNYDLPQHINKYQEIPGSGVNKMSYYGYMDMVKSYPWNIASHYTNHFTKRPILMKFLNIAVKLIPFKKIKEFIIVNSYTKLIKK